MTAETLSKSYFFEFPGLSHGILDSNASTMKLGLQFLEDPGILPNDPCFEGLQETDYL